MTQGNKWQRQRRWGGITCHYLIKILREANGTVIVVNIVIQKVSQMKVKWNSLLISSYFEVLHFLPGLPWIWIRVEPIVVNIHCLLPPNGHPEQSWTFFELNNIFRRENHWGSPNQLPRQRLTKFDINRHKSMWQNDKNRCISTHRQ